MEMYEFIHIFIHEQVVVQGTLKLLCYIAFVFCTPAAGASAQLTSGLQG